MPQHVGQTTSAQMTGAGAYLNHPVGAGSYQLSLLDNDGKVVTGTDRAGDQWTITVHGPGAVIVTDVTPNDGSLDDAIDTIQLIGTDPNTTYVTGSVVASASQVTDGTVTFQHLTSVNGVNHIVLNGFNLTRYEVPAEGSTVAPGVYLPGGARYLSFNDIITTIDTSTGEQNFPYQVIIGDPANPLKFQPTIKLHSIWNTVYDSTTPATPGVPQTTPTVQILVNGQIRSLEYANSTQQPELAGYQYLYPQTSTTGRTTVQATAIKRATIVGSARNTTLSTSSTAFANGLTGLKKLGSLTVGGVTDGLGVDVSQGNIGKLRAVRGLGDPTGAQPWNQATWGTPTANFGNGAYGLYGALVVAKKVGSVETGPSTMTFQTGMNPETQQLRPGVQRYLARAGNSLTNTAIVSDGSIGQTTVVGNLQGSEIKAGANYTSYAAGLQATRAASRIGPLRIRGNLITSVVASSYRPSADGEYGTLTTTATGGLTTDDEAGPGEIVGNLEQGSLYNAPFSAAAFNISVQNEVNPPDTSTPATTILGHTGVGFYARSKVGYLPPPEHANRIDSINRGNTQN